jgi:hypothetical protein
LNKADVGIDGNELSCEASPCGSRTPDGEHVQLTVESAARPEHEDPLELAARVYRGLQPEEIDEIERIALDRSQFFTRTHP